MTRSLEYMGYLPYLKNDLKVSSHPQFKHLDHPPSGYRFFHQPSWTEAPQRLTKYFSGQSRWAQAEKLFQQGRVGRTALDLTTAGWALALRSRRAGASAKEIAKFFWTRLPALPGQILIPYRTDMAFVPSFPVLLGQVPWVIEIEDTTTLFYPFVHNGWAEVRRPSEIPCFKIVKSMIEDGACKGILTHVRSTAESIPKLFANPALAKKVFYVPLGIPPMPARLRENASDENLNLLFTNSWHQNSFSFYYRGGLDLLEAFQILKNRHPSIQLTLRTELPTDLPERYKWIIRTYGVRVMDQFLPPDKHDQLIEDTDIFVLPAARLHVVSILEMMGRGIPVVVSDGWGIEEYVEDGRNGVVVRGRYGKCTWMDDESGLLHEDYSSLLESDPEYSQALADKISALIQDPKLLRRISSSGIRDVRERYSLEQMNTALKSALDHAFGADSADLRG